MDLLPVGPNPRGGRLPSLKISNDHNLWNGLSDPLFGGIQEKIMRCLKRATHIAYWLVDIMTLSFCCAAAFQSTFVSFCQFHFHSFSQKFHVQFLLHFVMRLSAFSCTIICHYFVLTVYITRSSATAQKLETGRQQRMSLQLS